MGEYPLVVVYTSYSSGLVVLKWIHCWCHNELMHTGYTDIRDSLSFHYILIITQGIKPKNTTSFIFFHFCSMILCCQFLVLWLIELAVANEYTKISNVTSDKGTINQKYFDISQNPSQKKKTQHDKCCCCCCVGQRSK